jgi:hypothetical protein
MISRRQSAALRPLGLNFDRFLYAPVGDDQQGGLLSVVSALARVGVDPWEEAASLARLPFDGAVQALCELLARLPAGRGRPVDPVPLATRLVALLPRRAGEPESVGDSSGPARAVLSDRNRVLIFVAFLLMLVVTQLVMQHRLAAAAAPAATPAADVTGASTD